MAKWPELRELAHRSLGSSTPSRKKTQIWACLEQALDEASVSEKKEIRELQEALDLRKHPQPSLGVVQTIWILIKSVVCLLVVMVLAPIMIIVSPIAYLNPLWKKLGLEKNSLPTEYIQLSVFRWTCYCLGLEICTEGQEQVEERPTIFLFSHASNIDPVVVGAVTPFPVKFIAKRVIFYFPILGWLFKAYGHIPIDRANLSSAIESLKRAARNVRISNVSIAISPEGTRSVSGHLQSFKKGPFHLSSRTRLPIVPVVILGAYEKMPPFGILIRPGRVTLRYLKPITDHIDNPDLDIDQLSQIVRQSMLQGLAQEDDPQPPRKVHVFQETVFTMLLPAVIVIYVLVYLYLNS